MITVAVDSFDFFVLCAGSESRVSAGLAGELALELNEQSPVLSMEKQSSLSQPLVRLHDALVLHVQPQVLHFHLLLRSHQPSLRLLLFLRWSPCPPLPATISDTLLLEIETRCLCIIWARVSTRVLDKAMRKEHALEIANE